MRKSGEYYVVEFRCTKENAVELIDWLIKQEQSLDRVESTVTTDEELALIDLKAKMEENTSTNGFLLEINFKDEEVALLAKLKFGN